MCVPGNWRANIVNIDTAGLAALEELRQELVSCGIQVHALTLTHLVCTKEMEYNHSKFLGKIIRFSC
jgi:ribulose 1,5-bisphosphate carboxylase large subunit-like protein